MKPIRHTLMARLPRLRIYRDDLDQLISLFEKVGATVTISDNENCYDSLDEMKAHRGVKIRDLQIEGQKPDIHFLLNQSTTVVSSGSTSIVYYTELRTNEISDDAENLFYRVRDFLLKRKAPTFRWFFFVPAIIAFFASLLFIFVGYFTSKQSQFAWGFSICLIAAIVLSIFSSDSRSSICLETRINSPSFFVRNRDEIARQGIVATFALIVGIVVGLVIAHFTTR